MSSALEVRVVDAMESKAGLRREMSLRRISLSPEFISEVGLAVAERCLARREFEAATDIGLYWPARGEVPTQELFRRLKDRSRRIYLPRISSAGGRLEFVAADLERGLKPGMFGILEPEPSDEATDLAKLQVLVVPGLAFDLKGARIGWGQGCYDRSFADFSGFRVALAYDFQVLARIPESEHDERVDIIVTEARVIECDRSR